MTHDEYTDYEIKRRRSCVSQAFEQLQLARGETLLAMGSLTLDEQLIYMHAAEIYLRGALALLTLG